jgi:aminoglycoside phosphotransferase (APT) family kinase protein
MSGHGDENRRIDAAGLSALLGVCVTAVQVLEDTAGSANRLRLRLTYRDDAVGLPERMFLKRNLARFNFPSEMYSTEVRMYRDVLPALGLEQPAVYAIDSADDDTRFSILMEDLALRPGARVGSVLDPTGPDEVDSLLDTLARLHAAWWDGQRLSARLPWAKAPVDNAQMRFWAEIGPRLARRHLSSGHRAALVDRQRWPEADWWPAFGRMLVTASGGPHTLLHGDVHASNVYYDVAGGSGGLLDWQLALRGCWALDVTYLMITALAPSHRAANERDLLSAYLDRLRALGVEPPALDEAWLRYRQNVLYGVMMWLITPDGVHTDEAQACFLERCLTAAEELETMAALRS